MPNLVFCLMGPTASGKTEMATHLIQALPCEIISVDSAMIYKGMDIGTAKPSLLELQQAPHHLIDICDPIDSYSVAQFCEAVKALCQAIHARGRVPLLVGGTMMYFHALEQGLSNLPVASLPIRQMLRQDIERFGLAYLHQSLARVDHVSAQKIHPNDTQRILRALEIYLLTGQPLSALLQAKEHTLAAQFVNFILMPANRAWLHERIAKRFETMIAQGLITEVEQLLHQWPLTADHPAMRTVGYRQVFEYLQGEYDKKTLQDKGIAATRQLAKRQMTWLRHWSSAYYFDPAHPETTNHIIAIMKEKYHAQSS